MAIGPEDEIFVLRSLRDCVVSTCKTSLYLERFLPDGQIDPSFGVNGAGAVVPVAARIEAFFPGSLAVAPDGRPVIAVKEGADIALFRFDRNGALDPTFGVGGKVAVDFGGDESSPQVAVQPDGRIVLAVGTSLGNNTILARYGQTGELDPSFGAGSPGSSGAGRLQISGGLMPSALALSNSGNIAFGAPGCCLARGRLAYLGSRRADGGLVSGSRRSTWHSVRVGREASVSSVVALPNGKVYLVGASEEGAFAVKLLADGRVDAGFGRKGIVRFPAMTSSYARPQAAVDAAGRLIVAGAGVNEDEPFGYPQVVARRLPDGRRDRIWAGGRSVVSASSYAITQVIAIGLQAKGKVVIFSVAGGCVRSCNSDRRLLTRFVGGSERPRCLGRRATIVGSDRPERIVGTPRRDVIAAQGGDDTVYGRGGNDLICGGRGTDELFGGAGRDRLHL
ncbi:MAG TPA: hypothetical protein VEW07_00685 [Solirubrobacterales bacterium]|nr:hypothetical protein [Solirubrobacterales bacterium]